VISNLSMNALDAMKDHGGILEITLENIEIKNAETLPGGPLGHFVKLTVGDTGPGIPSQHLEHIFDPFFSTKKVGEGEGIGLAVAYGIVRKNGGTIQIETQIDQGSKFCVFLPAST
jgi:signal transduction histidine kinase